LNAVVMIGNSFVRQIAPNALSSRLDELTNMILNDCTRYHEELAEASHLDFIPVKRISPTNTSAKVFYCENLKAFHNLLKTSRLYGDRFDIQSLIVVPGGAVFPRTNHRLSEWYNLKGGECGSHYKLFGLDNSERDQLGYIGCQNFFGARGEDSPKILVFDYKWLLQVQDEIWPQEKICSQWSFSEWQSLTMQSVESLGESATKILDNEMETFRFLDPESQNHEVFIREVFRKDFSNCSEQSKRFFSSFVPEPIPTLLQFRKNTEGEFRPPAPPDAHWAEVEKVAYICPASGLNCLGALSSFSKDKSISDLKVTFFDVNRAQIENHKQMWEHLKTLSFDEIKEQTEIKHLDKKTCDLVLANEPTYLHLDVFNASQSNIDEIEAAVGPLDTRNFVSILHLSNIQEFSSSIVRFNGLVRGLKIKWFIEKLRNGLKNLLVTGETPFGGYYSVQFLENYNFYVHKMYENRKAWSWLAQNCTNGSQALGVCESGPIYANPMVDEQISTQDWFFDQEIVHLECVPEQWDRHFELSPGDFLEPTYVESISQISSQVRLYVENFEGTIYVFKKVDYNPMALPRSVFVSSGATLRLKGKDAISFFNKGSQAAKLRFCKDEQ
jgi:hypothetical protein